LELQNISVITISQSHFFDKAFGVKIEIRVVLHDPNKFILAIAAALVKDNYIKQTTICIIDKH